MSLAPWIGNIYAQEVQSKRNGMFRRARIINVTNGGVYKVNSQDELIVLHGELAGGASPELAYLDLPILVNGGVIANSLLGHRIAVLALNTCTAGGTAAQRNGRVIVRSGAGDIAVNEQAVSASLSMRTNNVVDGNGTGTMRYIEFLVYAVDGVNLGYMCVDSHYGN